MNADPNKNNRRRTVKTRSRFTTLLTVYFFVALIIPNCVLANTEPYSVWTVEALILMPLGFYMMWSVALRRSGIMIWLAFPFIFLCAFQIVMLYLFGNSIIATDKVQQHDLEGAEEDEREGQPDHHARTPQRHAPHYVESQRHEDQRLDGPHRVRLRIGQHAVGDDQRHEEIDGQQRREAAAGLDRPPAVRLIRVIQIGIHTNSLKKPR